MIVSKRHRFVFVQTPKTGSTSMKTALQPYQEYPRVARHAPLSMILDHHPEVKDYFKFGVTRDPKAWRDSCYRWARRKQDHQAAHRNMTYPEWRASNYVPNWWHRDGISKYLPPWHMVEPDDWVAGCDFILRFERLDEDWQALGWRLELPLPALQHLNADKHKDEYTTLRTN